MVTSCFSIVSLYDTFLRRSLSNAGLSSQTLAIDDQTTLHYWGPKSPAKTSPKPALLLIHGFGPSGAWQWRQQVVSFAPHFDLYIPDLVFFGNSTTTSDERSELFQATAVAKLMEKVGVEKYSVVGTSYGGFVAYRLAAMWRDRVEKVVVASSGVNLRRRDNLELMKRARVEKIEEFMLPKTAGELRTLMRLAVAQRFYMPELFLNDFVDKLYSENRAEKLELLKGLSFGHADEINHISPLQQDVLIVWGEQDQIFLLEKATELKEVIGKKVTLEVIKNASHVPQLEQAKQFNKIVYTFLTPPS